MEDIDPVGMNPVGLKEDGATGVALELRSKLLRDITNEDMLDDKVDVMLTEPLADTLADLLSDPLATTAELPLPQVYTLAKLVKVR